MLNAGRMSSLFEVVREFYLPHVVTDTDSNIGNRVTSAIKNLIAGTFEKVNESRVKVSDSPPSAFYARRLDWHRASPS